MRRIAGSPAAGLLVLLSTSCGSSGPTEPFAEPVVLELESGSSSEEIAQRLEDRGVIGSKWAFLWHRAWNRDTVLMAGEYEFLRPLPAAEAFGMLADGRVRLYPVTFPEGLNRFESARVAAATGIVSGDEFLRLSEDPSPVRDILPKAQSLEGCLFPETYSLSKTSTARDLIRAMVERFRESISAAREQRTAEIGNWDALVLASMIEKEAGDPSERKLVSSVFHNRIRRGMLMQCDPTIIYGLVLQDRYRGRIYRSDLSDPHPYNTYVHSGLPPGPIANPGSQSLSAAFAPDESDYLFFVAKPGYLLGHVFSKSLRAHNRAVAELRRYERSGR